MTSLAPMYRDVYRVAYRPSPRRTLSRWCDDEVTLAATEGGGAGKWRTDRAAYLREPMDLVGDDVTQRIVVMKSGQAGATLALTVLPALYFMHSDPTTYLMVCPSESLAHAWSVARFEPNRLATPVTRDAIRSSGDGGARYAGNTQLYKAFDGGYLFTAWSSSDKQMRSRPARVVNCDEVDAYEPTKEGDPVKRAERAATTYGDRAKVVLNSTPTIKGHSRIEREFLFSDQRYYHVPCPACDHRQPLVWEQVRYDGNDPESSPSTARYVCRSCEAEWDDAAKNEAVRVADLTRDAWVPMFPGRAVAGFHINALMSSFVSMAALVSDWLRAQGDHEALQVFYNLKLGLTWEIRGEGMGQDALLARRETYAAPAPAGVALLTAAVDVQDDRFEVQVEGWGAGRENWKVQHHVIVGDVHARSTQGLLDDFLKGTWRHENGTDLPLRCWVMDSGDGDHTQMVYAFTKARWGRRGYAVKGGSKSDGKGLVRPRPTVDDKSRAKFFVFSPNTAKDMVFGMLKVQTPGPRYVHLPAEATEDWVAQLLVEKKYPKRMTDGTTKWEYRKPGGARNEALDLCTMNLVALALSGVPDDRLGRMAEALMGNRVEREPDAATPDEAAPETQDDDTFTPGRRVVRVARSGSGWINGFRRV